MFSSRDSLLPILFFTSSFSTKTEKQEWWIYPEFQIRFPPPPTTVALSFLLFIQFRGLSERYKKGGYPESEKRPDWTFHKFWDSESADRIFWPAPISDFESAELRNLRSGLKARRMKERNCQSRAVAATHAGRQRRWCLLSSEIKSFPSKKGPA